MHACRWSACIETTFGMMEGNMAKKAKKAKKVQATVKPLTPALATPTAPIVGLDTFKKK